MSGWIWLLIASRAGRKWRIWEEIIQNEVSLGWNLTIKVTLLKILNTSFCFPQPISLLMRQKQSEPPREENCPSREESPMGTRLIERTKATRTCIKGLEQQRLDWDQHNLYSWIRLDSVMSYEGKFLTFVLSQDCHLALFLFKNNANTS